MAKALIWPRNIQPSLQLALEGFRVVALTGARQTGKTTLARALVEERGGRYVSLDEERQRAAVLADPEGALVGPYPLVVDEFQRGGDTLLLAIKRLVDEDDARGRFLLTGSANFLTVPRLSESLAGRVGLVDMWPLSQGELRRRRDRLAERLFGPPDGLRRLKLDRFTRAELYEAAVAGGYPEAVRLLPARRASWFRSYLRTIVHRDIRDLTQARRIADLPRLLRLLSARTACETNLSDVSRDLDMPRSSIETYVSLLEAVCLWMRLPAWSRNLTKKAAKHPKGHVTDSGLAASLLGVDAAALASPTSAVRGPLLETFVAVELAKQRTWSEVPFDLLHFRDRAGYEVDIVLEAHDGRIAAVEVKASASVDSRSLSTLSALRERLGRSFANGVILYLGDDVVPFGDRLTALPLSALWAP